MPPLAVKAYPMDRDDEFSMHLIHIRRRNANSPKYQLNPNEICATVCANMCKRWKQEMQTMNKHDIIIYRMDGSVVEKDALIATSNVCDVSLLYKAI